VQSSLFIPLSERSSLFLVGSGGTNFGSRTSVYQQFRLGGPLRLTAYSQNEFRGERYALGSVGYLRSIARLPAVLGKKIYLTGILERGGAFNGPGSTSYQNSVSLGLAADTLLGPIVLGGSLGDGNRRAFYFSLGRLF
jgi:NTE family protein